MPKDTSEPLIFEQYYCDNCGDDTRWISRNQMGGYSVEDEGHSITELKINIDSANAGESGVLCDECFAWYEQELKNA